MLKQTCKRSAFIVSTLIATLVLSGCANNPYASNGTTADTLGGAGLGAVAGAVVGSAVGSPMAGAAVGAGLGGLAGYGVAHSGNRRYPQRYQQQQQYQPQQQYRQSCPPGYSCVPNGG